MSKNKDVRNDLKAYFQKIETLSVPHETQWVSIRPCPPLFPKSTQGLIVIKYSGEKLLILGWFGHPSSCLLQFPRTFTALKGKLENGVSVSLEPSYSIDSKLYCDKNPHLQLFAFRLRKLIVGSPRKLASQATFRLVNFDLEIGNIRKTKTGYRNYPPLLRFKHVNTTFVVRGTSKPNRDPHAPESQYHLSSKLTITAKRPRPWKELQDEGWKITNLLSLASANRVGYLDIEFRPVGMAKPWSIAYDRSVPPNKSRHGTVTFGTVCFSLTRMYLPRLLKCGIKNIENAHSNYGFFLALRHWINAQHSTIIQEKLTSLFQGFETCMSVFRASGNKIPLTRNEAEEKAYQWLMSIMKEKSPNKRIRITLEQLFKRPPRAKTETLPTLLDSLGLKADLGFWVRRTDMFHRGDINRDIGLSAVAQHMKEADDLLARILLRSVGYSGKYFRLDTDGWPCEGKIP